MAMATRIWGLLLAMLVAPHQAWLARSPRVSARTSLSHSMMKWPWEGWGKGSGAVQDGAQGAPLVTAPSVVAPSATKAPEREMINPSELLAPAPFVWPTPASTTSATATGSSAGDSGKMKLGVLLLNLGGPASMEDVEGFLYNLFADPDIIRLPSIISFLQKPIAYVIAKRRAPVSSKNYESIGGGSPIVKYTQAQADLIRENLASRGFDAECYFAMRYWNPYTEEVLSKILKDGINTLVIVPLYPPYSISTSGSSLRLLQNIFLSNPQIWGQDKIAHTVVPAWYYRKGYVQAMARLVVNEIAAFDRAVLEREGVHVLFSAHGVPSSYIEAGDPYQRQIEECVKLISREISRILRDDKLRPAAIPREMGAMLAGAIGGEVEEVWAAAMDASSGGCKEVQYHLSFQSRVGPVQWLKPYTEEKLIELGEQRNVKNLVVVPVSFVSEHIETLEEIDMEYRELALEHGVVNWRRVPALNTDHGFIADMADMVVDALESPSLSVSEAADQNLFGGDNMGKMGSGLAEVASRTPITNRVEQLSGRFAMLGIVGTTLAELVNGHTVVQMVGLR